MSLTLRENGRARSYGVISHPFTLPFVASTTIAANATTAVISRANVTANTLIQLTPVGDAAVWVSARAAGNFTITIRRGDTAVSPDLPITVVYTVYP